MLRSSLTSFDGFKGFVLLRRDGADPDGFNYSTWSLWRDRAAFDAWKNAPKEKPSAPPAQGAASGSASGGPPSIYARAPVPTFYEGILVLESPKGV